MYMELPIFKDDLTQPSSNPPDFSPATVVNNGSWTETEGSRTTTRSITRFPDIVFGGPAAIIAAGNLTIISDEARSFIQLSYGRESTRHWLSIPEGSTFQAIFRPFASFLTDSINLVITSAGATVFNGSAAVGPGFTYSIRITSAIEVDDLIITFNIGGSFDRIQIFSTIKIIGPGGGSGDLGGRIRRLLCDPVCHCICHNKRHKKAKKCNKCARKHICKFCGCEPQKNTCKCNEDANSCCN